MGTVVLPWNETPGQPNNINHVMANDQALRDGINGGIDGVNAPALVAPPRILATGTGLMTGLAANTYYPTGTIWRASGVSDIFVGLAIIDAASLAIAGVTPKLRTRVGLTTNGTAAAINFTFGLYPYTPSGGGGALTITLGTVISGSTVAFNTPAINSKLPGVSGDFSLPADGLYVIGAVLSGTMAVSSAVVPTVEIELRHT